MPNEDNKNSQAIQVLQQELEALKGAYYLNNFLTSKDENKYVRFNTRLKIPSASTTPTTCEVGELVEVAGVAYICSASNTWTKIGLQV